MKERKTMLREVKNIFTNLMLPLKTEGLDF